MALWTLGTVMSQATAILGGRADIALSTASLYANQAALDVTLAVEPQEMESIAISSTTSGTNRVTLPSDFQAMLEVSNLSVSPPMILPKRNYMDADSAFTTLSTPTNYVLYDTWLELVPSPDSAYSIQMRYQARPSVLTATTAVPSFDTRFGVAWLYKTASYLAWAVKDYETASAMDQKYLATIAVIPTDLALRQRDRTGQNVRLKIKDDPAVQPGDLFDNSVFPGYSGLYGP